MKKKTAVLLLGFLFGIFLLAPSCKAVDYMNSLRCANSQLVMLGDSKLDVVSKCGDPAMKESVGKQYGLSGGVYESRVQEEWTYNFGPNDFLYVLTFEGGFLKTIGRGGRGR